MRIQDYIVDLTKAAAAETFRYAKAVPEAKVAWSPGGDARSVLSMCQEIAKSADWAFEIIGGSSNWSEEAMAATKVEMAGWTTVAQCEEVFAQKFVRVEKLFREMPDERLTETHWLPFNGGRDHAILEMMEYVRWNCIYHTGQIAYIQVMYGDKEMH
jgi:uncharacterized damage-inducible protein DinB